MRQKSNFLRKEIALQVRSSKREVLQYWPASIVVLLLLACTDYWQLPAQGGARYYALALAACLLAIASDGRRRPPIRNSSTSPAQVAAVMYGLYIMFIYLAQWVLRSRGEETTIFVVGAFILATAPIIYRLLPRATPRATNSFWHSTVSVVSVAFGLLAILDVQRAHPSEPPAFFNHETVFIAVLVLSLPSSKRLLIAKFLTVSALALSFLHYPSATSVLGLVAAVLIYASICYMPTVKRFVLVGTFTSVAALFLIIFETLLQDFYKAFGRVDNSSTRERLWEQGVRALEDNFFLGSWGEKSITGFANIRGVLQPVPFHNSYLTIAVFGGLVALVLFSFILISSLTASLKVSVAESPTASFWAPALLCVAIAMIVNPILDNAASAFPLYLLLVIALGCQSSSYIQVNQVQKDVKTIAKERHFHRA